MILRTFLQDTVDFWGKRGCVPQMNYVLQGFTCWEITIPDEHQDLKNPDYVGLQVQEVTTTLPEIVRRRLTPPVHTLKMGKLFADIQDKSGKRGVPFSHNYSILEHMCLRPAYPDPPTIVKLNSSPRVQDVLLKAQRHGTENLLFFVRTNVCETVPIVSALRVLKHL